MTIGFYDGVHVGHRLLLGEVRRLAAERGARTAVVTFDRHPATVVRPESAPLLLTDLEQRLELLASTQVDQTVVVTFDEARAKEAAEDFVMEVLVDCLQARAVVVGEDFHFGHQRRGNVALLREMGREHGFEVDGIKLVASGVAGARPVSSTAIREAVLAGDLASANRMLGREHELRGAVVARDERVAVAGVPTVTVAIAERMCVPATGSYAGWCALPGGNVRPAAIAIGAPGAPGDAVDVHLLDFSDDSSGDLQGARVKVRFSARLPDGAPTESARAALGI